MIMTRTRDERLAENQVEDLKARVALMNEAEPALVVSVHQNSYHEEGVTGLRSFTIQIRRRASARQGFFRGR